METNKVRNTREDRLKVNEEKRRRGGEQSRETIEALWRPVVCESAEGKFLRKVPFRHKSIQSALRKHGNTL